MRTILPQDEDCKKLNELQQKFLKFACMAPSVAVCRCSPLQKAQVVKIVKQHTNKVCGAVGDGGNDVTMIMEAHAGIGIEGKEGK